MSNNKINDEFLSKLSSEQREFVQFNNNNALVSASAGSGKTFTMISKLVALIVYYDIDIDDLLVVTFTNAAGEELKQKLYSALLKELNTTQNISINKDKIYQMLERINTCDIGTLHSVCYKYIMKFFYKCGVSPTSSILMEEDTNYLLNDAINTVIESSVEDEDFYELFNAYSGKRNNAKIVNMIKSLYYFMESLPNAEDYIKNVVNNKNNNNLNTNICANYILNTLKDSFNECERDFKSLVIEAETLGLPKYVDSINSIIRAITEYKNCKTYIDASKYINNSFVIQSATKPRNADGEVLDFVERYKYSKDILTKTLKNLKTYFVNLTESEIINTESKVLKNVNKCIEIVKLVKEKYCSLKQAKDGLDFGDLEHCMLKLLQDNVVLNELQNKYKYIFVDEYQDINNLQEQILLKLSNGLNLYMIGDVKQSIYGFRLCTPDIFIEKYNSYKKLQNNGKSIEFNKNFRSVDSILQFVNYIFSNIATENTMGIDYKTSSMLVCGKEVQKNSEDSVDVELNIINKDVEVEVAEETEEDEIDDFEDAEAKLTVNKVKEYLTKQYINLDTKEQVNIEPKDIAILIRDKGSLLYKVYAELQNNNIPVSTDLKLNLFSAFEVNLITCYFKLLSNIKDDISFATVLRSVIVGLTDNQLLKIRNVEKLDTFADAVLYYANNVDDEISFKLNKFLNELNNYRFSLSNSSLKEVALDIITKYNLNSYFYGFIDGVQKIKNIEIFINLLDNKNYQYNISKFLDYVELLSQKKYDCSVQNGVNAVTIMTMHKSKGLDYPVVIVSGLGKKFSNQTLTADAIITNELGVGLKYNDVVNRTTTSTIAYMANRLNKELAERKEQLRLYYVALTRAKNYLSLIGSFNLNRLKNITNKDILKCNSFLELTLYSLLKHGNYNKLTNVNSNISTYNNLSFTSNMYTIYDIYGEDVDKKLPISKNKLYVDSDLSTELKRSFMYIYPYTKHKNVALKTSVSTMLSEADYVENNYEPQELVIGENNKTGSFGIEVGNAYHGIMERVDYLADNDVNAILTELVLSGKVSPDVAKVVDVSKINYAISVVKNMMLPNTKLLKEQQFIIRDKHCNLVKTSSDDTLVMVQGVIDLVLINDNGCVLIDFKTNKVSTEDDLIQKYKLQIDLYAKAISEATNKKVTSKYLYSFCLNKMINL